MRFKHPLVATTRDRLEGRLGRDLGRVARQLVSARDLCQSPDAAVPRTIDSQWQLTSVRADGLPCRRSRVRVPSSALSEAPAKGALLVSGGDSRIAAWRSKAGIRQGVGPTTDERGERAARVRALCGRALDLRLNHAGDTDDDDHQRNRTPPLFPEGAEAMCALAASPKQP